MLGLPITPYFTYKYQVKSRLRRVSVHYYDLMGVSE